MSNENVLFTAENGYAKPFWEASNMRVDAKHKQVVTDFRFLDNNIRDPENKHRGALDSLMPTCVCVVYNAAGTKHGIWAVESREMYNFKIIAIFHIDAAGAMQTKIVRKFYIDIDVQNAITELLVDIPVIVPASTGVPPSAGVSPVPTKYNTWRLAMAVIIVIAMCKIKDLVLAEWLLMAISGISIMFVRLVIDTVVVLGINRFLNPVRPTRYYAVWFYASIDKMLVLCMIISLLGTVVLSIVNFLFSQSLTMNSNMWALAAITYTAMSAIYAFIY